MSDLRSLSYLAARIELGGLLDAVSVQVEYHGGGLTEEQVKNWLKIVHLGQLFIDQCEESLLEVAAKNVLVSQKNKRITELELKLRDLRIENSRVSRMNSELLEALSNGIQE